MRPGLDGARDRHERRILDRLVAERMAGLVSVGRMERKLAALADMENGETRMDRQEVDTRARRMIERAWPDGRRAETAVHRVADYRDALRGVGGPSVDPTLVADLTTLLDLAQSVTTTARPSPRGPSVEARMQTVAEATAALSDLVQRMIEQHATDARTLSRRIGQLEAGLLGGARATTGVVQVGDRITLRIDDGQPRVRQIVGRVRAIEPGRDGEGRPALMLVWAQEPDA